MTAGPHEPACDDRVAIRAATIDELLSDEFETLPGQKRDSDRATQRLAAWCKSSSSGDWQQFSRRLARDSHTFEQVLARFATARRRAESPLPQWANDATWVQQALRESADTSADAATGRFPFAQLFLPLVDAADARLWASTDSRILTPTARQCLTYLLLGDLSELCAPALFERFSAHPRYAEFIRDMKTEGFHRLLDEKPVLLRLIASTTRQWLDTSREFVGRLDADVDLLRRNLLDTAADCKVARVDGGFSDRHHGGRSVLRVEFEDGRHVMYKPKDLRLDVAWYSLIGHLNTEAPVDLRTVKTIARDGYGWTEFIEHSGCTTVDGIRRFFRRAGAWLALFHCFAAGDIHQENLVAAGDHPVPVDLETILQATVDNRRPAAPESHALHAARALIANSVMAVGLLPAYGRSADHRIYAVGGVASDWTTGTRLQWHDTNSDAMRPAMVDVAGTPATNLPRIDDHYTTLGEHLDDFISGFEDYANFLLPRSRDAEQGRLFYEFTGLPVRNVIRPTQFYYMLLQRLKDDRTMNDGPMWSAQADFLARLADWDDDDDPMWPLQHAERAALLELNVPHFVTSASVQRAKDRVRKLDEHEIAWQVDVIRQASSVLPDLPTQQLAVDVPTTVPGPELFAAEADAVADEIAHCAVRRESSAAWIGLSWFSDADVAQLAVLGHDLYNGSCGIALFLAAHASVTGSASSEELALASVSHLRAELNSRGAPHLARLLGIGGGTGLGSVVYGLTVISTLLQDDDVLDDAQRAVALMSDDLIASDAQLDVVSGSAGAILGLLRLYADTHASDALDRAVRCADHLLIRERMGEVGRRSWRGAAPDAEPLNGMSHGAAGFAYALASLATVTGREDFTAAAAESIGYERSHYDAERRDWRDFRVNAPHWRSQWCHGAVGIGLSRLGMAKRDTPLTAVATDIDDALDGAMRGWPGHVDTLCCGSLGSIELCWEAGKVLDRADLRQLSSKRLAAVLASRAATGDYRWNGGARRFNIGLFRGLAGVGYTCLRQVDNSLPNVLIWE